MQHRRIWLVLPLLLVVVSGFAIQRANSARLGSTGNTSGRKSANLQEQLEAGLKARRPEEFAFIRRVILLVEEGKLPASLVRSTFDWARPKRPYPFPYFERGLKVRAARIGVRVQ